MPKTAKEWGLVNRVVDDEALMEEARSLAASAARQPPGAVRATKRLMRSAESAQVAALMQEELREFADAPALAGVRGRRPGIFRQVGRRGPAAEPEPRRTVISRWLPREMTSAGSPPAPCRAGCNGR